MISDAILGLTCDYALAPTARLVGHWGIPILTSRGQVQQLNAKVVGLYPTLIRMMGSYSIFGEAMQHILKDFGWKVTGLFCHNNARNSPKGHSTCSFILGSILSSFVKNNTTKKEFDEDNSTANDYKKYLEELSEHARSKFVSR